jgi:hypothetical protein
LPDPQVEMQVFTQALHDSIAVPVSRQDGYAILRNYEAL